MVLTAATATAEGGPPSGLMLAGLVLAAALVYAASCAWWPFRNCICCGGDGKHSRGDRKVFRRCRWCKGTGRRLRLGRRVWNHFARLRRDAT